MPSSVAVTLLVVLTLGWLVYIWANLRKARPEVGSEIELAPNRKPYLDDEALEGRKLETTQMLGVVLLVVSAVGLPLYWLNEPGRMEGAIAGYNKRFAGWGANDFDVTANGGFNCAGCHGGMKATGGVAPYTITSPTTGEIRAVSWKAPALDTVLYRFSEDEVRFILVYGRPYSPMSPWGIAGGGPMNDQQIQNIIEYLKSIQVPMEGCAEGETICADGRAPKSLTDEIQKDAEALVASGQAKSMGEALFKLESASGAYSCARCHTTGWSYGSAQASGGGAMGPNLTGGSTVRQFPSQADMTTFIAKGSEVGKRYGQQGQGSGRMPGFGQLLTDEQVKAIVEYERSL
ncbi:MAG TPA: c-type cytochrome [Acidimicrobiales bacterium]